MAILLKYKILNYLIMKNHLHSSLAIGFKALVFSIITFFAVSCSKDDDSTPETVAVEPQMIAHYTFDNDYNDVNGKMPFEDNELTSFSGNTLRIAAGTGTSAGITGIPTGNQSRTIAFFCKLEPAKVDIVEAEPAKKLSSKGVEKAVDNVVFSYGISESNRNFGMYIGGADGSHIFQGFGTGNDHNFDTDFNTNIWVYVLFTYNGKTLTLYLNGDKQGTFDTKLDTGYSVFKLGNANVATNIDDLRIYNYAFTQAEVDALYDDYRK
jgi:hypothetical protein